MKISTEKLVHIVAIFRADRRTAGHTDRHEYYIVAVDKPE